MYYTADYDSPLGQMILASNGKHLVGAWFTGQKYFGGNLNMEQTEKKDLPVFAKTIHWLDRYFAKEKPSIEELELDPAGTPFQKQVWNLLCQIPYGSTITYSDLGKQMAVRMGKIHMSSQAIGNAVGHNPISIIVPCHRVVGKDGSLTGYAGGIQRKISLLQIEGVDLSRLYVPESNQKAGDR